MRLNRIGMNRVVWTGIVGALASDLLVNLPYGLAMDARSRTSARYVSGESVALLLVGSAPFLLGAGALAGAIAATVINSVLSKMPFPSEMTDGDVGSVSAS